MSRNAHDDFPLDPQADATRKARRRRRFAPVAVLAGVGATAALALSMTGTLSAFTAQITNSANSVTDGTLVMSESGNGGATTCTSNEGTTTNGANTGNSQYGQNAAICSTINKYGGALLVPGVASTPVSVTIADTGTATPTSFTLTPGVCNQTPTTPPTGAATDLCSQLKLTVKQTPNGGAQSTLVNGVSLSALAGAPITITPPAPGASNGTTFTFSVTLPAGLANSYQGLGANQQLVWAFSAGS